MDLNAFGTALVLQLTRIADALEGGAAGSTKEVAGAAVDKNVKAPADKPAARTTKPKPETAAKPTHSRDEVNAALIKLKDDCGKEHAQGLIKQFGYTKMAEIAEKDFDAMFDAAEAKHAEMVAESDDALDEM